MQALRLPTVSARPAARPLRAPAPPRASAIAEPATLPIKGADGSDQGTAELALKVASPQTARHVVHRYMVQINQNARQGSASAKTRAEVSGGGRKPLQQKGSGQARKGSTRTPLTKGGGVVFGPKPKDWSISMNKKERRLAVGTALQSAAPDTVVVDSFASIGEALKTKAVVNLCKNVGVDVNETWTLIVTDGKNEAVERCAKNLKHVAVNSSETLHFYDVLRADKIVVENGALALLHERYT